MLLSQNSMPLNEKGRKNLYIADLIAAAGEIIIAGLLLFILFMGIGSFMLQIFTSFSSEIYSIENIKLLIDKALILFLIIELYTITVAYLKGEPVVREVFIAAFIAVGRKILIYDFEKWGITGAISLSLLIFALAASYFLLHRVSFGLIDKEEE